MRQRGNDTQNKINIKQHINVKLCGRDSTCQQGLEIVIIPVKEGNQGIGAKHICI